MINLDKSTIEKFSKIVTAFNSFIQKEPNINPKFKQGIRKQLNKKEIKK